MNDYGNNKHDENENDKNINGTPEDTAENTEADVKDNKEVPETVYKRGKHQSKVSFTVFAVVLAVAIVITALLTFVLTMNECRKSYGSDDPVITEDTGNTDDTGNEDKYSPKIDSALTELATLDKLFSENYYGYGDIDKEELAVNMLKAYVAATGDKYAEYFTEEEYRQFISDNVGDMEGIGVSVVYNNINVNGQEVPVIQIIAVFPDSPANKSDLRPGDCIIYIGKDDELESVSKLGYTNGVNKLRGKSGTTAEFTVLRKNTSGDYEEIQFSIVRAAYVSQSVMYRKYSADSSIGIIKILNFDLTTPKQFKEAVNALKNDGCDYFVFDVRNNPGGDLASIEAVLSYFLKNNDLLVTTEDRYGNINKEDKVKEIKYNGDYADCSITKEDIGCFSDLKCVVLTNGNTASAAELFTATLRDYNIAKIIGTTTYGKGCMQTTYRLSRYGIPGAYKLTTQMYFSKSHTVYHDIGIKPDYEVELSEEAQKYNVYLLPDELDNQLIKGIEILK